MNIFLLVLQVLLALHTIMGAVWKLSNTEQTVPSLSAIPHTAWLILCVIEIICALGLILPLVNKRLAIVAPLAAIGIAAEMIGFCGLQMVSGVGTSGELIYWIVVAVICTFIAYGRLMLKPIGK